MSRRRAAGALALAALVAAGCGLDALGDGPEVATTTGGDAAGAGGDGGTTEPGDLGTEGGVVLLPPVDGGSDAPTGHPGFCASQTTPFFACWDFDDVEPGGNLGFGSEVSAGGSLDVVYEGTNHVLQAALPQAAFSRTAYGRRAVTGFGALGSRYEMTFAFGVRQSSLAYVALGAFWVTTSNTANVFGPASHSNGAAIDMLLPDRSAQRLAAPSGPAWRKASVTLVPDGTAMQATVVVDGVTLQNEKVTIGPAGATSVDVRFGTYFTGADYGGITVVFDDIVVRKQ